MSDALFALERVRTARLDLAYEAYGGVEGTPVVLLHGFPYDPRAYDGVAPALAAHGCRVIVPYLRGFGPTRFLAPDIPRSGQQAALAQDLLDLLDALRIPRAALMGYDWGGRAACIVAALQPQRVRCLVTGQGYNVHDIAASAAPQEPAQEHRLWYQYYFHSPRGRAGLAAKRRELCELLWRLWSPQWRFTPAQYERTAASFDNPDFVDVVVHSYQHRYAYAAGDPAYEGMERLLARQPAIGIATINLCGGDDGVGPTPQADSQAVHFTGPYERRVLERVGHNYPQEDPAAALAAMLYLLERTA